MIPLYTEQLLQDRLTEYQHFLEGKIIQTPAYGFEVPLTELHPYLLPHQRDIVHWAIEGGRRAILARFGLGKTVMQM